ncbi:VWA domain-containing protein [Paracoccus sp. MBLB3053]|uniref:VWA domain-containing protein n=1 Tax=Paracoccus aurantius TaxID=3073814 RepID=A0ABU2HWB9_9RHOB|nr:VWA domain-containing protein [Paracoccus sp. MBLB3053]MDS9469343.1 VWA domain-containing protein [Paracoccus sp. MBLB3053]
MNALSDLAGLTFLRPLWLLAIPALALVWWQLRQREASESPALPEIAPHLLRALTIGRGEASRSRAALIVLGAACLMAIGAAGPAFRPAPSPFVTETAPLVIALDLSPGMDMGDIPPSRLERAKQKIRDLIALRAGGRTGLIAYAGSAHLVMPPTEDPTVLQSFLEGLTPGIMPRAGQHPSEAMRLATTLLATEDQAGTVLFVTDGVDPTDIANFPTDGPGSVALIVAPDGGGPELDRWARAAGVRKVAVTVDDSDLRAVNRAAASSLARAASEDGRMRDDGWLLAIPAALLLLLWFRRGTTLHWAVIGAAVMLAPDARANELSDLFWTKDQQGARAYAARDFPQAAEDFVDPPWKAVSLMRSGQYGEAAAVLEPIQTSDAQFNRGIALIRGRDYPGAIAAFEAAVKLDPSDQAAQENLALARRILDYLNETREAEDTEVDSEDNAADGTVEDLQSDQGQMRRITGDSDLSEDAAEQWMKQVQTKPADFLKSRFAIEAAQTRAPSDTGAEVQ